MTIFIQVSFTVNTNNTKRVMYFVHNKHQVYIPDRTKLYGSFARVVEFPPVGENMKNGRLRYYEITKEHTKAINNEKEVCDDDEQKPDTEKCIQGRVFQNISLFLRKIFTFASLRLHTTKHWMPVLVV